MAQDTYLCIASWQWCALVSYSVITWPWSLGSSRSAEPQVSDTVHLEYASQPIYHVSQGVTGTFGDNLIFELSDDTRSPVIRSIIQLRSFHVTQYGLEFTLV